ncbi:MAG: hypothetical protein BGO67_09100 [Alphaproteobacteria bacterium 41-28]|nr:MAG: hypothetical protein BGO67_09100 [Alphaproteobacteria bacterium 41-28]
MPLPMMGNANLREQSMKKILSYLIISSLFSHAICASIPTKGSPDRCKDKNILPVDDLLPLTYRDPMDDGMKKAIEKMSQVTPERMIQSVVDHLFSYHDLCNEKVAGVGGWADGIGTALCERLIAFDITHEGMLSQTKSKIPSSDLTFLQTAYKTCRLSTERYWNYPSVAHISYNPTPEERAYLNKMTGLSRFNY